MKTRIIGDIHGHIGPYINLLVDCDASIQVGDFGYGFINEPAERLVSDIHESGDHKFIRGNHDDPAKCKVAPGWIQDGLVRNDVMFIGGAWSIDWHLRTE